MNKNVNRFFGLFLLPLLGATCTHGSSSLKDGSPVSGGGYAEGHPGPAGFRFVIQDGHTSRIWSLAYSPGGDILASGSHDGTIQLRNRDGFLLRTLRRETGGVFPGFLYSLAFSPDGKILVSASDHDLQIWSREGRLLKTIPANGAYAVAFSPAGDVFIAGYMDGRIDAWSPSGRPVKTFRGHTGQVYGLAFAPGGDRFASASQDGTLRLWQRKGAVPRVLRGHGGYVNCVAWSPDGKTIASGSDDGTVRFWAPDGSNLKVLKGAGGMVRSLAFDRDGKMLAIGSEKGLISLLEVRTGRIKRIKGHSSGVFSLAFHPDGDLLASGSGVDDRRPLALKGVNVIKLWRTDGTLLRVLEGHRERINKPCYSPDGRRFATTADDGSIQLWEDDGRLMKILRGHKGIIGALAFSPDGRLLASGGRDRTVCLWDSEGRLTRKVKGHMGTVTSLAFAPDGKGFVSGAEDMTVRYWSLRGKEMKRLLLYEGKVAGLRFCGQGTLAVLTDRGILHLYDAGGNPAGNLRSGGTRFQELTRGLYCAGQLNSPYGALRVKISGNEIRVEGNRTMTLRGHATGVTGVAFSPDGKRLISTSGDATVRLWNLENGKSMTLIPHDTGEWFMFNGDGYWDSSRRGGSEIAMVSGDEAWGVDQFAAVNNRPDRLYGDVFPERKDLIAHYYARYQKRLEGLGVGDKTQRRNLEAPRARILSSALNGPDANLRCLFQSGRYRLVMYNLYVNDNPLFGSLGKKITGGSCQVRERIRLSPGRNKVEVSCFDERGIESFRALAYLRREDRARGDLYFLGFGVSRYQREYLNLKYAHKDVKDLARLFRGMEGRGFNRVHVRTYLNSEVTAESIRRSKSFLEKAAVEDTFVLFIAGHGMRGRDNLAAYYYLTHESDPENLKRTSVEYSQIEGLLQGIAPRSKLFLMDTCESGEAEEGMVEDVSKRARGLGLRGRAVEFGPRGFRVKASAGVRGRAYLWQRDRFIYNILARRSGAVVFSASRGGEYSFERDSLQNGVFTRVIIEALKGRKADRDRDGQVSVDELRDYVSRKVSRMTGGLQNPSVDRDNLYQKFGFSPAVP